MNDLLYSFKMSRRNTNKNVSASALSRSEKEQIGSLFFSGISFVYSHKNMLAQLNDNARSERNLTDEQNLLLRIVIDKYLSQQVFEPSLLAKFSASSLLSWEEITKCYSTLGLLHCFACWQDQCLSNV